MSALIFQNYSAGIGTLPRLAACYNYCTGLPRFLRAGPSTSLDKSDIYAFVVENYSQFANFCQP
jgi:hypothetical protein